MRSPSSKPRGNGPCGPHFVMVRIEENVRGFLLEMGRAGGGDERRDDEITWTVGGSPIGYHNAVVRCDTSSARVDALIEDWLDALRSRQLPGSWHVSPSMRPIDIVDRLLSSGLEDGGDEPAMAADLTAMPAAPDAPADLVIERVRDGATLDVYRRILGNGFGEGPPEADWVADVFARIGLGDDVPWRHYVGRVEGEPVCTTTLFLTAGVAGVYFVSTVPEARRRGVGAAITRHAMTQAVELGCTTAILGSSPMGQRVYERLGFREVFRHRMLESSPS